MQIKQMYLSASWRNQLQTALAKRSRNGGVVIEAFWLANAFLAADCLTQRLHGHLRNCVPLYKPNVWTLCLPTPIVTNVSQSSMHINYSSNRVSFLFLMNQETLLPLAHEIHECARARAHSIQFYVIVLWRRLVNWMIYLCNTEHPSLQGIHLRDVSCIGLLDTHTRCGKTKSSLRQRTHEH